MVSMNRLSNTQNNFQGDRKRVLCVCSAGLLRSPTVAHVLGNYPYNFNTRAVGCNKEYALIPVDEALLYWAEEVVFMEYEHFEIVSEMFPKYLHNYRVLNIPDEFETFDDRLMDIIEDKYNESELCKFEREVND
jgi:predicted protein tyrosine phosphatase